MAQLAAEEMGCLESLENLHIPAQDALAPIHHEIFEEDLDTHLQFSSLLQVRPSPMDTLHEASPRPTTFSAVRVTTPSSDAPPRLACNLQGVS